MKVWWEIKKRNPGNIMKVVNYYIEVEGKIYILTDYRKAGNNKRWNIYRRKEFGWFIYAKYHPDLKFLSFFYIEDHKIRYIKRKDESTRDSLEG